MIREAAVVILLLTGLLGWSLWRAETHKSNAELAGIAADNAIDALSRANGIIEAERSRAEQYHDIGESHETDRRDAESVPAAVVADLRTGNLRLRKELAGCATDNAVLSASAAAERDAAAAVREQIAGDLVRAGRDADDQLRSCQAVIRADRGL